MIRRQVGDILIAVLACVMGAFLASLTLCNCTGAKRTVIPGFNDTPSNVCIKLVERCEVTGKKNDCDAADACVNLWERASFEWSWRKELEATTDVDASVAAGKVAKLEIELDHEKMLQWVWGAVGFVAGAAVVGISVGLAQ